jgi:ribonuclease R
LGEHCSRTERRADEATRDVAERLKCIYLRDHVGAQFDVIVSGVAAFGLFVHLQQLQIDGLVHVTALPADYYHRDATGTLLTGERSGTVYRLTDPLRVRLAAVNVDERKIDFVLAEPPEAPPAQSRRPRRRGRKNRRG